MNKHILIILMAFAVAFTGCNESEFADNYANPGRIGETTVPKQFTGILVANKDYVMPAYYNYFVLHRTSLSRWTQAVGWVNGISQYVIGAAGLDAHWNTYYNMLTQYREMEKVYNALSEEDQAKHRIYWLAATVYLYDHTQKMVDLFGNIPFEEAGRLSQNGGDYLASLPAYDSSTDLYTKMLDDLQMIAGELSSISVDAPVKTVFDTQDYINGGDIMLWSKYCNSLRLRILNRASGASEFATRADTEMASILSNPSSVITSNAENAQIEVVSLDTPINSSGFRSGLEDWDGNVAGKKMIDHMVANSDPRLRAMFEPGELAGGVYQGIDPLANDDVQQDLIDDQLVSIYNRSTLSRNQFFPGVLINAAEVSFLKAEYYLRNSNDTDAKAAYEMGIKQSIEWYYWVRTLTDDEIAGTLTPTDATEIDAYIAATDIAWGGTSAEKLALIAAQKWIHYSVVQLHESYAENRRLDLPALDFLPDPSNAQTLPPVRFLYPDSERSRNTENYQSVSSMDNMTTNLFWDN
jgi:hypothetical protein